VVERPSVAFTFQAREHLLKIGAAENLVLGARAAVRDCLGVQPEEVVVLLVETPLEDIAAAILIELEAVGARVTPYLVHESQVRNESFVQRIEQKLGEAAVSFLLCTTTGLPPAFRRRVINAPGRTRRHGHMVGVTPAMMEQSMRADYAEVHALGEAVMRRVRPESLITVSTPAGTNLRIRCQPGHRWVNASGFLRSGGWTNLPGGELFTTPGAVAGTVVADAGIWMGDTGELPKGARLTLTFDDARCTRIDGDAEAAATLAQRLDEVTNARRVGQIGFGTNTGVVTPIGSLLQDLKMPGFHLSLGHTCPEVTSATWTASLEVPILMRRADVSIDGAAVMQRGRWLRDV
jgi:leucyl aminopeptidase (aminopeptidase T)